MDNVATCYNLIAGKCISTQQKDQRAQIAGGDIEFIGRLLCVGESGDFILKRDRGGEERWEEKK